jgi:hypothetical protein
MRQELCPQCAELLRAQVRDLLLIIRETRHPDPRVSALAKRLLEANYSDVSTALYPPAQLPTEMPLNHHQEGAF